LSFPSNRTLEYAPVDDIYCPPLHRANQIVRHRAIYPDDGVPPIPPILVKYAQPPKELVDKAKSRLDDLISEAKVKKGKYLVGPTTDPYRYTDDDSAVPPKAIGKRQRDVPKPLSGLDVDALLKLPENKRAKIDPNNAVPEFKQMVDNASDDADFEDAAKQMGQIVRQVVTDSFGDSNYNRAIEDMRVFREKMTNLEEPELYNSFIMDLKTRLLSGELGGDRRELWWQMKGARLGLIDREAVDVSKVTPEEAAEVSQLGPGELLFMTLIPHHSFLGSSSCLGMRVGARKPAEVNVF
jgi:ATP-dependent DNA helicase 2 subunit 2